MLTMTDDFLLNWAFYAVVLFRFEHFLVNFRFCVTASKSLSKYIHKHNMKLNINPYTSQDQKRHYV